MFALRGSGVCMALLQQQQTMQRAARATCCDSSAVSAAAEASYQHRQQHSPCSKFHISAPTPPLLAGVLLYITAVPCFPICAAPPLIPAGLLPAAGRPGAFPLSLANGSQPDLERLRHAAAADCAGLQARPPQAWHQPARRAVRPGGCSARLPDITCGFWFARGVCCDWLSLRCKSVVWCVV